MQPTSDNAIMTSKPRNPLTDRVNRIATLNANVDACPICNEPVKAIDVEDDGSFSGGNIIVAHTTDSTTGDTCRAPDLETAKEMEQTMAMAQATDHMESGI